MVSLVLLSQSYVNLYSWALISYDYSDTLVPGYGYVFAYDERPGKYVFFYGRSATLIYVEIDTGLSSVLRYKEYSINPGWGDVSAFYKDSVGYTLGIIGQTSPYIDSLYVFIIRFDTNGNVVWAKAYNRQSTSKNYDFLAEALKMLKMPVGYIVISLTDTFDTTYSDRFIAYENPVIYRIDDDGNVLWAKAWKYQDRELVISDAFINSRGNIYFTGWTYDLSGTSHYDIISGEMDTLGNLLWMKVYVDPRPSGVIQLIPFDDRIIGIMGQGTGFVPCGGAVFDTSMNLLGIKRANTYDYMNIFRRDFYTQTNDTLYISGCIMDTAFTFVYPVRYPIIKSGRKKLFMDLLERMFYRDSLMFCDGSMPKINDFLTYAFYPYDITDSITVLPFDITPDNVSFTLIDSSARMLVRICSTRVVSIDEGKRRYICSAKYEVYTVSGRLVRKGEGKEDLRDLPKGVYMIRRGERVYKVIRR